MRSLIPILLFGLILSVGLAAPLRADYLKNADLKEGIACWRGDGKIVYLKADGTEGDESDPQATPVLKITLSSHRTRMVFQTFSAWDKPVTMHLKVDIMASEDFKPSIDPRDYTDTGATAGSTGSADNDTVPKVDFWVSCAPDFFCAYGEAKKKNWTTVEGNFKDIEKDVDRAVNFCVPPGEGSIYVKNIVVEP